MILSLAYFHQRLHNRIILHQKYFNVILIKDLLSAHFIQIKFVSHLLHVQAIFFMLWYTLAT